MEGTAAKQAREKAVNPAVAGKAASSAAPAGARTMFDSDIMPRSIGYGMPCAKCRAYYPADMQACPICKSRGRMSPTAVPPLPTTSAAPQAAEATLAEERERLRELKSQIYASHPQVGAATFRCALDQNHDGGTEPAAVCHSCYGELRQQADHMEAALHMDVKDAGKIVYEAVWADTSDPNKTYINAAGALLTELRKRAGISTH